MNKLERIKELEDQISKAQAQINKLKQPEYVFVVITHAEQDNWYADKIGEVYYVLNEQKNNRDSIYLPLFSTNFEEYGISPEHCTVITEETVSDVLYNFTDIKEKK